MVRAREDAGEESRRARVLWRTAELLLLLTVYLVVATFVHHGSWTHLLVFGAIYLPAALALGQLRERKPSHS